MSSTPAPRTWIGPLALIGATLAWAGNFVVGGAAADEMGVLSLAWMRWALALIPLIIIAQLVERPDWRMIARSWPRIVLLAVLGLATYNITLYLSLSGGSAVNSSLINAANPALIAIAAAMFLRSRVGVRGVCGILLAFIGVVWILTDGAPAQLVTEPLSASSLWMIVAVCAWTGYTLVGRTGPALPPISSVAAQALVAVVGLAPFAFADGVQLPATGGGWGALIYIAIFPSIVSYVLWNTALRTIPPAKAGIFLNLITVFTVAASALLGEPVTTAEVVGGVTVLVGVGLTADWGARRGARGVRGER